MSAGSKHYDPVEVAALSADEVADALGDLVLSGLTGGAMG